MKTKEEILAPFIERPFRHTEVVDKDNALLAMGVYADQLNGIKWIACKDKLPEPYKRILYWDNRDEGMVGVGFFMADQSKVPSFITHWMELPSKPTN